jgi:pimeloyl-ACP methyl ester carboxylesterase
MPLVSVVRFLLSLVSLAFLAGGVALLVDWGRDDVVRGVTDFWDDRHDWRLWAGVGLLALWGFGRAPVLFLIARPSREDDHFERGEAQAVRAPDGGALAVEIDGQAGAPTIILTHGQGLDRSVWAPIRDRLADRFRVLIWDLPGLGESDRPSDRDHGVEAAADALAALIEAVDARDCVLVGHSFGGMATQELAKRRPDLLESRVVGVALLHTTFQNPLRTMIASKLALALRHPVLEPGSRLTAWLEPLAWANAWQSHFSGAAHLANRLQCDGSVTRRQLDHVALVGVRNPPGAVERRNLGMYRWQGLDGAALTVPTLVVAGGADIVTKAEAGRTIAGALPNARLEIVPDANHLGPFERPETYAGLIAAFAEDVAERRGRSGR